MEVFKLKHEEGLLTNFKRCYDDFKNFKEGFQPVMKPMDGACIVIEP